MPASPPPPSHVPLIARLLAPLLVRLPPLARRPVLVAVYALGTLLLLMALAWAGMPALLRWQIESRGSEKLGRAVTLQKVDFAPWALRTTLHGLAVAKAQGQGSQLQVERIEFRTALASLWNGAPVIDRLTIVAPHLVLAHRGGGHYDVDNILQRLAAEPDDPQRPPTRFALRNFHLSGGELDFDDRGKPHRLRELALELPEISSLQRDRDDPVAPSLAFVLDGSRFDSRAQATPFADLRQGEVALRFQGLDLAPYLDYLPADAPLRLSAGLLDADVKIRFAEPAHAAAPAAAAAGQAAPPATPAQAALDVSGMLTAHKLVLAGPVPGVGHADFATERLQVSIGHLRPFAREVAIDRVELAAPRLELHRTGAAPGQGGGTRFPSAPAQPAAPAWKLALGKLSVQGGRVAWNDATVAPPAALGLQGLSLEAGPAVWPLAAAVPFELRTELAGPAPAGKPGAAPTLAVQGQAGLQDGKAAVTLAGLPLAWAAPYIQGMLRPALEGVLGTEASLAWSPAGLTADAKRVQLDRLALRQKADTLLGARQLLLDGVLVDTARHSARLQRVALGDPSGTIARDAQGRWMFEDWLVSPPASARTGSSAASPEWQLALGTLEVQGGAFAFRDASRRRPVAVQVSGLRLALGDVAWPPGPVAASGKGKPATLDLALQLAAGQATAGSLRYQGSVALAPFGLQGQLNAKRLPVGAFEPYFGDALNVQVSRADVGFDGKVAASLPPAGLQLQLDGDASVEDGRIDSATPEAPAASPAASVAPASTVAAAVQARGALTAGVRRASTLLSWKTLGLRGVSVAVVPGQPLRGSVGETTLGDFFARIAIDETGRINLRDLVRQAPGAGAGNLAVADAPSSAVPAASPSAAPAGDAMVASGDGVEATAAPARPAPARGAPVVSAAPVSSPAPATPEAASPVLRFGPTRIVNGRVEFADRFIKPNYSASLSELNGSLGGFASATGSAGEVQMAALELRGKAEGTASLEVTGKLNPLAKPLALDVTGKVRDLDLPALSPYAVKYAGHGIERGKLSMDVNYQVLPNGQLTAKNSLVLHQLTFGEQVAGAPASLPVQLAVALLADRNGVIDLDLPISGSLNDPQFSLGPVIGKALLNLLVKAVTAPFSLLAHAFGGADEAAQAGAVPFDPGSSVLTPAAREQLDKVAQVLKDKPALQVSVAGTASLAAEQDGYRRQRLLQLTRFEKRRKLLAAPQAAAADAADVADVTVSPAEYPELLRQVYARTDMPKPRNLIGLAKDLPLDEMEKLMMAQIDVDAATMQALAVQRGGVVRDYLAAQGVPADRLYLGAPRQVEDTTGWTPRAELKLAAR